MKNGQMLQLYFHPKKERRFANKERCKGSKRAYSLGLIIVANTVGSQHAVTRILGFEDNAAGFWTWTLLKEYFY